jgi:hypothetical protein
MFQMIVDKMTGRREHSAIVAELDAARIIREGIADAAAEHIEIRLSARPRLKSLEPYRYAARFGKERYPAS